jgi:tRNA (guanine-N7-)-methyltransferase
MGQKKLIRFEAIKSFPNVLQYPEGMAGQWAGFFKNDNPLTLELACGKGEYTVGLAKMYPQRNFLGIDLKGNRIYAGAKKCLEEHISNAAFLRSHIDKINNYFAPGEVEEIWLTFPDPQLRASKAGKRLTHPKFLRLYQRVLIPGGPIHLKTDSPVLYGFTKLVTDLYKLPLLEDSDDIYASGAAPGQASGRALNEASDMTPDQASGVTSGRSPAMKEELKIRTHYEGLDIAQSNRVHYLCFTLPEDALPDLDTQLKEKLKEGEPLQR